MLLLCSSASDWAILLQRWLQKYRRILVMLTVAKEERGFSPQYIFLSCFHFVPFNKVLFCFVTWLGLGFITINTYWSILLLSIQPSNTIGSKLHVLYVFQIRCKTFYRHYSITTPTTVYAAYTYSDNWLLKKTNLIRYYKVNKK